MAGPTQGKKGLVRSEEAERATAISSLRRRRGGGGVATGNSEGSGPQRARPPGHPGTGSRGGREME